MYCVDVTSVVDAVLEEAKRVTEEDRADAIEGEPVAISNGTWVAKAILPNGLGPKSLRCSRVSCRV